MVHLKWRMVNGRWTTTYLGLTIRQSHAQKRFRRTIQYVITRSDKSYVISTELSLIKAVMFCHSYSPKIKMENK